MRWQRARDELRAEEGLRNLWIAHDEGVGDRDLRWVETGGRLRSSAVYIYLGPHSASAREMPES